MQKSTQFQPGKSGNPGGRPAIPAELREAAREAAVAHTPRAIELLAKLMENRKAPTVALGAITLMLDRALGKPETTATITASVEEAPWVGGRREKFERARRLAFVLTQGLEFKKQLDTEAAAIAATNAPETTS